MEQLDKGLIDFGLLYDSVDIAKYETLKIPIKDVWGVLMRRDSPLAAKEVICPEDLWDKPLIVSHQENAKRIISEWLKQDLSKLNIVATYNLVLNASLLTDEGFGYTICFDKLLCWHKLWDNRLYGRLLKCTANTSNTQHNENCPNRQFK